MPWMADGEADIDGGTRAKAGVGNTDPHGEFGLPKTLRQNDDLVDVYVGAGCFWHIQHELVKWEQTVLGRSPDEITAVVGYAGAALVDGGGNTQKAVCYNTKDETDYGAMGHTEAVAIKVPKSRLEAFLRDVFFSLFSSRDGERADPQDVGPEYRSAIFLPFGKDEKEERENVGGSAARTGSFGVYEALLRRTNDESRSGKAPMTLLPGRGSDPDTLGRGGLIWVLDSDRYPFYRGEMWHQFHDDMVEKYPEKYHRLKDTLVKNGRVAPTGCPERRASNGWHGMF